MNPRYALPAAILTAAVLVPTAASADFRSASAFDARGDSTIPGQYDLASGNIIYDQMGGSIQSSVSLQEAPKPGHAPLFIQVALGRLEGTQRDHTCIPVDAAVVGAVGEEGTTTSTSAQIPTSSELIPGVGRLSLNFGMIRIDGQHAGLTWIDAQCAIISTSESGAIGSTPTDELSLVLSGWRPATKQPRIASSRLRATKSHRVSFRVRRGSRATRALFELRTTTSSRELLGQAAATIKPGRGQQTVTVRLNARGRALMAKAPSRSVRLSLLAPGAAPSGKTVRLTR